MNSTGMVKARMVSADGVEYGAIKEDLFRISTGGLDFDCCLCDLGICNRNCELIKRCYSRNKQYANAMEQVSMAFGNPEWKTGWIYMPVCENCSFLKAEDNDSTLRWTFGESFGLTAGQSRRIATKYGMKLGGREACVLQMGIDFAIFMKTSSVGGVGWLAVCSDCPYYDAHFVTAGQLK